MHLMCTSFICFHYCMIAAIICLVIANVELFFFQRVKVDSPVLPKDPTDLVSSVMYPRQCIESQSTYQGQATATVEWTLGNARKTFEISLGHIPIMVKV